MGTRLLAALAEKRPRRGGKMLSGWKNCRWMELVGIPNEEDSFLLLLLLFATVDDCSFLGHTFFVSMNAMIYWCFARWHVFQEERSKLIP